MDFFYYDVRGPQRDARRAVRREAGGPGAAPGRRRRRARIETKSSFLTFFFLFLLFPDTCCGLPIHGPCVAQCEADNVNQCVTKGKCPNCAKKYKKRGTAAEAKFVVKWANQGAEWAKQWLEKEATDGNEHAKTEKENVTDA